MPVVCQMFWNKLKLQHRLIHHVVNVHLESLKINSKTEIEKQLISADKQVGYMRECVITIITVRLFRIHRDH